ncbi:MAG: MobA/MobL family protein [Proteobacteria bacterium]|nr:MobA/MobL family protein [Pseudomonadota bacterium]
MATVGWYHASLRPIGRSAGRSAVACAAYRTGTRMADERYAAVRDFSRKADVVTAFTLAPDEAPAWAHDAESLWNAAEAREARKNAQVAFEWEVALPNELTAERREAIARDFSSWLVEEYGVGVTTGIHTGAERGNGLNDHMHVMMTTRGLGADGWEKNKLRDFSTKPGSPNAEVTRVREHIADLINDALEDAGSADRVDHRSFAARGIQRQPTTHLGPAAAAMERKHIHGSDRGDINREIIEDRLAWQLEQTSPEITPDLDEEFSRRWEGWQPLRRCEIPEGACALERGTPADTSDEHYGWRRFVDRVRAFADRAVQFWHDETSGVPEPERGLAARAFDAGRKLWSGLKHDRVREAFDGLNDTADLIEGISQPTGSDPVEAFAGRLRERAAELWRDQHGTVGDSIEDAVRSWQSRVSTPAADNHQPVADGSSPSPREPDGPDIG